MRELGLVITIALMVSMLLYLGWKPPLMRNLKDSVGAFLVALILFSIQKLLGDIGVGFQRSWDSVILWASGVALIVLLLGHKIFEKNMGRAEPGDARNGGNAPEDDRSP